MVDLAEWNLTIPEPSSPVVIETNVLNRNYRSDYFYRTPDGSVTLWAPVTGRYTPELNYPSTELRETRPDGSEYNWKYEDSVSLMQADLRVNQVPSSGKMIIGQIRTVGDSQGTPDSALISLRYRLDPTMEGKTPVTGQVEALIRTKPDTLKIPPQILLRNIPLDGPFSYELRLSRTGVLSVRLFTHGRGNGELSVQLDQRWASYPLYFKAGAYVEDKEGPSTEGGKVTFNRLVTMHQPNNR
ncbi:MULTISPECIES: polysaccharide lyase family 7 protein [unclassified Pseudomonas]|uniref:polysaccharide lyase family 7 protein n=1 Tax=unclassified Pseudomonas TaxID=196821 RepID=UPI00257C30A0|nr:MULTISPECIES: polysaccharide lyase family 7 protein [unclassified Pseudomonas]